MNNTKQHQKLVDDLLFAFGSRDDVRIWRRDVGGVESANGRYVRYGISGESDLDGVVSPFGLSISVEVKTGTGKLRENQINWKKMKESFGAIHIEARSVEQAMEEFETKLKQWKERVKCFL